MNVIDSAASKKRAAARSRGANQLGSVKFPWSVLHAFGYQEGKKIDYRARQAGSRSRRDSRTCSKGNNDMQQPGLPRWLGRRASKIRQPANGRGRRTGQRRGSQRLICPVRLAVLLLQAGLSLVAAQRSLRRRRWCSGAAWAGQPAELQAGHLAELQAGLHARWWCSVRAGRHCGTLARQLADVERGVPA